jgi:nucleoside-diphosphate-sugar epimerase
MGVFVLGGTGASGGHVVPTLVGQGHAVTALARTPATAAVLTAQGATAVSGSIFDRSALAAVFAGMDAVVNLTSAISPMTRFLAARAWRDNDRVRGQGSAAVVDAATAAEVQRLLRESVAMLYRDHGWGWIDEDAPVDRYPRAGANLAAEANASRFTAGAGWGWCCALAGCTDPAPPTVSSCWPWLGGTSPWLWARPAALCPRSM